MTLKTRAQAAATSLSSVLFDVVPYTTGAAVLFTLGQSIARDARGGQQSWKNEFVGGAAAGAFVVGVKRKSLNAAFVGAIAMGSAAAAAQLAPRLQTGGAVKEDSAGPVLAPKDFSAGAKASSALHSRLQ